MGTDLPWISERGIIHSINILAILTIYQSFHFVHLLKHSFIRWNIHCFHSFIEPLTCLLTNSIMKLTMNSFIITTTIAYSLDQPALWRQSQTRWQRQRRGRQGERPRQERGPRQLDIQPPDKTNYLTTYLSLWWCTLCTTYHTWTTNHHLFTACLSVATSLCVSAE